MYTLGRRVQRAGAALTLAVLLAACGGGGGGGGDGGSVVSPSGPATPSLGAVAAADVIFGFDPNLGLSGQRPRVGYETAGENTVSFAAGASISYGGEPRISIVQDPKDPSRSVLRLMQRPGDPAIAGEPRTELNYYAGRPATTPPRNAWFWRVWQLYLPTWNSTNATYIVAQIHNTAGFSPPLTLSIRNGRYLVEARSATAIPMTQDDQVKRLTRMVGHVAIGTWTTIVQRVRLDPQAGGLQIWIDGKLSIDYDGPLGYADGEHYIKQGLYPLESTVSQEVLLRGPWLLHDAGYDEALLREWIATR